MPNEQLIPIINISFWGEFWVLRIDGHLNIPAKIELLDEHQLLVTTTTSNSYLASSPKGKLDLCIDIGNPNIAITRAKYIK